MASSSSTLQKKNTSLPPKRGQIKVQIFENLVSSVISTASKAGKALGIKGEGGAGGSSASTTPPPTGYNSEGNSDIS